MVRRVSWLIGAWVLLAGWGTSVGRAGPHTYKGELAIEQAQSDRGHNLGTLRLRYKFDTFLGEPIQMYVMAWEPVDLTQDLGVVKFRAQVAQGGRAIAAWIECEPMVPAAHKGFSSDFPGSPDWDEFFLDGAGGHLSEQEAKAIFKAGFALTNLEVISARALLGWKPGMPFDSFVGDSIKRPQDGRSDLEEALAVDRIQAAIDKLVGDADIPAPEFEHSGWVFEKAIRWTQGGRGRVEKLQVRVMGKSYEAVRLTMEFLPAGIPAEQVPRDVAAVELTVDYPFLNEERAFTTKLREGETWVTLLEAPLMPGRSPASFVSARAERLMTDQLIEDVPEATELAEDNAEDAAGEAAGAVAGSAPTFDPFAVAEQEQVASTASEIEEPESGQRSAPVRDPFAAAEDALATRQAKAAAEREADEISRGVTTLVYVVLEANRHLNLDDPFLPEIRGLRLSTDKFRDRMRNDPAFRAQVEARREREARERAERNRQAQSVRDAERTELWARLQARGDFPVYSEMQELPVSERPREPFTLSAEEEVAMREWQALVQSSLLTRVPVTAEFHSDGVSIKTHYFHTRAEALAFLADKTTKPLPSHLRL
ncbi:hypothetical protein [Actomonas aquatica]|uniref:DUF4424 domain-containing protein n=1 Tax=Actomonas aquatica TaxID=2866162 RepID=A0ABZ1CEN5_9BACT|nr:hypothetical protein [Opitutus sp. WL0086]WRQ90004.1 hypothetical protein K1X11_011350 [Opitutus sp. WL0086]